MPQLTRRRYPERHDCWHIYYGDVHAGTIAKRVGNPHDTDQWEWSCGFYPGSRPGEIRSGTSATFDDARAEFTTAGRCFWRTAPTPIFRRGVTSGIRPRGKYAMWDGGFKLPMQLPSGRSKCFSGADLTISGVTDHIRSVHGLMETV